jgi:hypothetical protein
VLLGFLSGENPPLISDYLEFSREIGTSIQGVSYKKEESLVLEE